MKGLIIGALVLTAIWGVILIGIINDAQDLAR